MKRKIICFLTVLLSISCNKFLDTSPTDIISPVQFYNTEEELNEALTGVYEVMGREQVYGMNYQFHITLGTDLTYMTGNQASGSLNTYQANSGNIYVRDLWRYMYFGIDRANNLLANIDKPDMDDKNRDHIEGEARFLRGYYYFLLVSNFGAVPLVLSPTASVDSVHIPRVPIDEVYEQVISDMTIAYSLLDEQTSTKLGFGGKVSKTVVAGILSRVYLHMAGFPLKDEAKFTEAKLWAERVINSGEHGLNPDYTNIFINYAQDKYDIKESIWEVEFWGNRTGNDFRETGRVGNFSGITANDEAIGVCGCLTRISGFFFEMYEVNESSSGILKDSPDLRRDWNAAQYSYGSSASNPQRIKTENTNIWNMNLGKWRREYEIVTPKHKAYTPQNFPLLRYSDVLLMYAEAENEINGPTGSAVEVVNEVRRRAYGKLLTGGSESTVDADLKPADISSKEAFRKAIQKERALELVGEALRKGDLIRWGILVDQLRESAQLVIDHAPENRKYTAQTGLNVSERDVLLPIPQYERNLNKALYQNPDW